MLLAVKFCDYSFGTAPVGNLFIKRFGNLDYCALSLLTDFCLIDDSIYGSAGIFSQDFLADEYCMNSIS